jgi:hypothetical protein
MSLLEKMLGTDISRGIDNAIALALYISNLRTNESIFESSHVGIAYKDVPRLTQLH